MRVTWTHNSNLTIYVTNNTPRFVWCFIRFLQYMNVLQRALVNWNVIQATAVFSTFLGEWETKKILNTQMYTQSTILTITLIIFFKYHNDTEKINIFLSFCMRMMYVYACWCCSLIRRYAFTVCSYSHRLSISESKRLKSFAHWRC